MPRLNTDLKPPRLPFVKLKQAKDDSSDSHPLFQALSYDPAKLYDWYYDRGTHANGTAIDAETRNLCLVALSAVGRAGWDQRSDGIVKARAGVYDWTHPVCCWASCVAWAVIAGALTYTQLNVFAEKLNAAVGTTGHVTVAKEVLWDNMAQTLGTTPWTSDAAMPLGSMVFLGSDRTKLHHVGIHVGHGLVVGACAPKCSPVVTALLDANLPAFTTIQTVDKILQRPEWTFFTDDAFWKGWPVS